MKNLVTTFPNIRVALNMHACACGPLFVTPFNFDETANTLLSSKKYAKAKAFYQSVYQEDAKKLGYIAGNGAATVAYQANGEASDWMLASQGVYAISPELGINDPES